MKKRLAIIGAGASGICAAFEAHRENPDIDITIFEKLPKAGKKILATGNGRCNFTNQNLSPSHFYGKRDFLLKVLTSEFSDIEGYFRSLGLLSYTEDERIYPRSQQASSLRDILLKTVESYGIKILTDSPVDKISKNDKGYLINGSVFDAVIVSGGGKASPVHGSDGSAYGLLTDFGHTLTPLYPALCGLVTEDKGLNMLKGVRAECNVALYSGNSFLGNESGEIQFTDKAVSGIPVMNLSHLCENKRSLRLVVDLCEEINKEELIDFLKTATASNPDTALEVILNGIVNIKIGFAVINKSFIKPQTLCGKLTQKQINQCADTLKAFEITIKGTKGFENAQITKGGINTDEVSPETMMSKKSSGLFACGEILDIHGDCGGYNLHLAWTTGRIAGNSAAKFLK